MKVSLMDLKEASDYLRESLKKQGVKERVILKILVSFNDIWSLQDPIFTKQWLDWKVKMILEEKNEIE